MARLNIIVTGERNVRGTRIDFDLTYDDLKGRKQLKDFVDKVVKAAEVTFETHVPKRTGKMLAATTSTATTPIPGGFEGAAGVGPIRSETKVGRQNYPLYVTRGTGLWGPSRSKIYRKHAGNVDYFIKGGKRPDVFAFEKHGQTVFITHFKGQPPKLILEHTKEDAKFDSVVRIAKKELGRNLTKAFDIDIRSR